MRILLIEDDKATADYIAKGLREIGHLVQVARTGRDGMLLLPELPAFPGDTDRTTATSYDTAAERPPDTCKPALQLTETAGSAEPESLHKTEDSATQREILQDVRPALKAALYPALPCPRPVTVTLLPPVDAAFVRRTELKVGAA